MNEEQFDQIMEASGIHYALVRGATDTEQLQARLPLGCSIQASLRHKDGPAWLVVWNDLPGIVTRPIAGNGITVKELPYSHPLVQRVCGEDDDAEDDDEGEGA